jgi:hypothetical protein
MRTRIPRPGRRVSHYFNSHQSDCRWISALPLPDGPQGSIHEYSTVGSRRSYRPDSSLSNGEQKGKTRACHTLGRWDTALYELCKDFSATVREFVHLGRRLGRGGDEEARAAELDVHHAHLRGLAQQIRLLDSQDLQQAAREVEHHARGFATRGRVARTSWPTTTLVFDRRPGCAKQCVSCMLRPVLSSVYLILKRLLLTSPSIPGGPASTTAAWAVFSPSDGSRLRS